VTKEKVGKRKKKKKKGKKRGLNKGTMRTIIMYKRDIQ
jgi:hypothetical protein